MHGTLIKEFDNASKTKLYKLDFKVYKGVDLTIKEIAEGVHLKPEWQFDGQTEWTDMVAISDAHTHYERLVFPVYNIINKKTGEKKPTWVLNQIAGEWTMMIYGGDISSILEPEEYFNQLYELNKGYNEVENVISIRN